MPSTRDVSVGVIGAKTVRLDGSVNPFLMSFGQYISHDTDLTRHMRQVNPGLTWFPDGGCKDDCSQRVPCFPIPISASDPRARSGQKCVEFIRSVAMCQPSPSGQQKDNPWTRSARVEPEAESQTRNSSSGSDAQEAENNGNDGDDENISKGRKRVKRNDYAASHSVPMEQANEVTSYVDASTVYGSTPGQAMNLRGENGTLKVSSTELFLKGLLPFRPTSMGCTPLFGKEIKRLVDIPCFAAGDGRVNEHLGLIVLHSIFHREHNRIVEELRKVNPHWDGDRLYQEARNINAAIHQHVTYNEYLPQILGPVGMKMIGRYTGYNPLVEPSVSSEFSTAAFRFGHAQIHPIQYRLDKDYREIPQGNLPIRLTFFSPYRVVEEGGLDPLLRGLIGTRGKEVATDSPLTESVIEELWVLTEKHALDLGALNTQRGRDHALRSYLDYRRYCLLSAPTTWDKFTSVMRKDIVTKLEELYGSPENIDLWVGAMLEELVPGADVGPTFTCMLVEGFRRVRDGDRFWFELPTVMSRDQAKEIKKTSLARIVCDNSDGIDRVPSNIFMMTHPEKMTSCDRIQGIDFSKWKEMGAHEPATMASMTMSTSLDDETSKSTDREPSSTERNPQSQTMTTTKTTTSATTTAFRIMPKDDPNSTRPSDASGTTTSAHASSASIAGSSASTAASSDQPPNIKQLLREIEDANPFASGGDNPMGISNTLT